MKKFIKLLVTTGLILATTITSAFAQSYQSTSWTIKDDVDYMLDSRYYKEANVNNYILSTLLNATNYYLNFAKQFDNFYLGLQYDGNLLGGSTFTNGKSTTTINLGSISNTTETKSKSSSISCYNGLEALLGIGNMGFGLNFSVIPTTNTSVSTTTSTNVAETTVKTVDNYTKFTIGGNWGGSFNVANFVLKPLASVSGTFQAVKKDPKAQYKKNPEFNLTLGSDFVFGDKVGLYSIFGVSYDLTLNGEKTYNVKDELIGGSKVATNKISLSYLLNYSFGNKVDLGAKIKLSQNFGSSELFDDTTTTEKTFEYSLYPNIYFGTKYHVKPSVFTIDAGFNFSLPNVTYTSTEIPADKKVTKNTSAYCSFNPSVKLGFEWTPFTNFVIDTGFSYSIGNSFDSLFNTISIGISYRK